MGLIRGGLVFVVGIILLITLFVGNTFLTLDLSLDYDSIKPELTTAVKNILDEQGNVTQQVEDNFEFAEKYCEENEEFVFSEGDLVFDVSCDTVDDGPDAFVEEGIESAIENVYYKNYDCEFLNCFEEEDVPLFLISKKANDFWHSKFYLALLFSLVLVGLMFLFIENKINLPIVVGSLLLISSIPFALLDKVLVISANTFVEIIQAVFSESSKVFWIMFFIGIALIAFGFLMKFFKAGMFFSKTINKFKKKDLKKK